MRNPCCYWQPVIDLFCDLWIQVPELNVDSLTVSVVPGDVGKPSAKLEKGLIGGGSCLWECPIFETVKFNQDAKTGKINERLYHFIVSTVRIRLVI